VSDMNRSFAGSMPEFYDRFLVPVMFEPFALDMASRLKGVQSGHVLEMAAGTGIVIRALAAVLPGSVSITATDLNPAMLKQAQSYAELERVVWRDADALSLPFPDQVFDYVICQFGVMFFPIRRQRSAKPFAFCCRAAGLFSTSGVTGKARFRIWRQSRLAELCHAILLPCWLPNTTIPKWSRPSSRQPALNGPRRKNSLKSVTSARPGKRRLQVATEVCCALKSTSMPLTVSTN
jgi:SAM-dependent methyltransferase